MLQNRKYLAVADEEGYVSVLDTSAPPPKGLHDEGSTPAQWLAHHNAIFDLAWCKVRAPPKIQEISGVELLKSGDMQPIQESYFIKWFQSCDVQPMPIDNIDCYCKDAQEVL